MPAILRIAENKGIYNPLILMYSKTGKGKQEATAADPEWRDNRMAIIDIMI